MSSYNKAIDDEIARLIIELQQLKGVRDFLEQQSIGKNVDYYILNGGIGGRIFVRTSEDPRFKHADHGRPYRFKSIFSESESRLLARIEYVDPKKGFYENNLSRFSRDHELQQDTSDSS